MPDIDPNLTGQTFSSLDYAHVIGGPLKAVSDNAIALSEASAAYIKKVGFRVTEDGEEEAIMSHISQTRTNADGTTSKTVYEFPIITFLPIPNIQLTTGTLSLDVEVSQSATSHEKIDAGGEGQAQVGWGPFSLSVKAKASYGKEFTRKTDTRAKQHIELNYAQADLPEGFHLILETLRNAIADPGAGRGRLPAPGSGEKPPQDAELV